MKNLSTVFDRSSNRVPLKELQNIQSMQRQMDRFFDQVWNNGAADLDSVNLGTPVFAPSCDVSETDTHYLLSFDLPGMKKEDVKIDLRDNALIISGDRKEEREENEKGRYRSERFYGTFERSLALPTNIKAGEIEAHYADGVLRVAVPKAEPSQVQQIKIGESKTGFFEKFFGQKKDETKKLHSH